MDSGEKIKQHTEKAYDKVNREKTLEQLKYMGIQGRMMKFIR